MRNFKLDARLLCLSILAFVSCQTDTSEQDIKKIEQLTQQVKTQYAPDSRVAIFDIEATAINHSYILNGSTNIPKALSNLKHELSGLNIAFIDSVSVLPEANLEGKTQGIIALSAANLRSTPKHSAELVTQGTLGDRKSTRLNSSHVKISYAVFCLKKKHTS